MNHFWCDHALDFFIVVSIIIPLVSHPLFWAVTEYTFLQRSISTDGLVALDFCYCYPRVIFLGPMYSNLPINFNNSLTLLMCIIFHTAAEVYIVTYLYSPPLTSVYNILGIPYYHQSHCTPLLILINSIVQPVRSFAFSQFRRNSLFRHACPQTLR